MDMNCVICLENLFDGQPLSNNRCGHLFHRSCLARHQRRSNLCPICRQVYNGSIAYPIFLNGRLNQPTNNQVQALPAVVPRDVQLNIQQQAQAGLEIEPPRVILPVAIDLAEAVQMPEGDIQNVIEPRPFELPVPIVLANIQQQAPAGHEIEPPRVILPVAIDLAEAVQMPEGEIQNVIEPIVFAQADAPHGQIDQDHQLAVDLQLAFQLEQEDYVGEPEFATSDLTNRVKNKPRVRRPVRKWTYNCYECVICKKKMTHNLNYNESDDENGGYVCSVACAKKAETK